MRGCALFRRTTFPVMQSLRSHAPAPTSAQSISGIEPPRLIRHPALPPSQLPARQCSASSGRPSLPKHTCPLQGPLSPLAHLSSSVSSRSSPSTTAAVPSGRCYQHPFFATPCHLLPTHLLQSPIPYSSHTTQHPSLLLSSKSDLQSLQCLSRPITTLRSASTSDASTSSPPPPQEASPFSTSFLSQAAAATALQERGVPLPQYCCGCGVKLQQADTSASGYFIIPSKLLELLEDDKLPTTSSPTSPAPKSFSPGSRGGRGGAKGGFQRKDLDGDDSMAADVHGDMGSMENRSEADGFLGFEDEGGEGREEAALPDILCQRCFSLRHAGKVKVDAAELELPEFDLAKKVGRKIALQKDRRAVVLACVDAADFDGSLPRAAIRSLYPPGYVEPRRGADKEQPDNRDPAVRFRLMVALNKVDLLPKEASHARLIQWVRIRMQQAGLPRAEKVFCVSAARGVGVKAMVDTVREGLGFRGDLWVVGAQNAGKSSLISAMKRVGGTSGQKDPTIAPLPGTTLGLINVPGLPLGAKNRAFDTPGVPHPYQLTSFLNPAEVKQILPTKPLIPRTFRLGAGYSILLGGLARVDVVSHPGQTVYLTFWCSTFVNLHMGKTEGVEERVEKHAGGQLSPPASQERFKELPAWVPTAVQVDGTAWNQSSSDIHIAGLGWVAVGVSGRASFTVWTAPQVAITTRPAMLPDYARDFCRPGFTSLLPKTAKGELQGAATGANGQGVVRGKGGKGAGRGAAAKAG